ncbi:MAG: cyclic nucleotide-binding domain-containing protein [Myxococcales bacterium]|nr:cyclic nucleotide-binding domain-containing protein [Myxococcales bacterium]
MRLGVTQEDLDALSRNAILGSLDPHELAALIEVLAQLAVTPGTQLVREGDEGDTMFFILEGRAVVTRNGQVLRRLQAPEHFGELAMLGVRRRAATVTAEGIMRLARLSRARYQALADRHPPVALHLLQAVVATLGDDVTSLSDSVIALSGRRNAARPINIRVRTPAGVKQVVAGTGAGALLPAQIEGRPVIAALLDSRPTMLDTPLVSDAVLEPVVVADLAGRDCLRRSLGLLLLEAGHAIDPQLELRLGHAVDDLRVVTVAGSELAGPIDNAGLCRRLERAMQRMVEQDLEFRWDYWNVDEARAQLQRQGWEDAALLLRTARSPVVALQTCGQVHASYVGPLVPGAGVLGGFRLLPHPEGLLLDHGPQLWAEAGIDAAAHQAEVEREQRCPRFGAPMVRAHRELLATMGVASVGDFNELCVRGEVARLIRVSEGFHEKRIGQIADEIAGRGGALRIIGIAGPSSSGKTTFIKRLSVQLEVAGISPVNLSLDDYYVDRERSPRDEAGEHDFEALEALDLALLRSQLQALVAGETVATPRYDFKAGCRVPGPGVPLSLQPHQVLLIEGIHALADALWPAELAPQAGMRIFVHPSTTLPIDRLTSTSSADLRLLRRIVRDRHGRATTAADSIARWPSVRRGERRHIYPTYGNADLVFDTALPYEIAVLKVYAERYLLEVREGDPSYPVAYRLRQLIDPYVTIYPDHVPPTSILREFVGGSGFEY